MKASVYSLQQACALSPVKGTVVISISSPHREPATLQEGWEDVLRLEFIEAARKCDTQERNPVLFNEDMAEQLDGFVRAHKDKDFVIHCHSGQSRGMAVAVFLRDIFGADLELHSVQTDAKASLSMLRLLMRPYDLS